MIPRGRKVIDAAGAAAVVGMNYKTFRNQLAGLPGFPGPVNPGRRKPLFDAEQVEAWRDERPVPALPEGEHDSDLLDEHDVAAVRGVQYATVRSERHTGRLTGWIDVCGVMHMPRGALAEQLAARPGRGVGGGRPRKDAPANTPGGSS